MRNGFTLIELMIVVAVLFILAAIAAPLFLSDTTNKRGNTVSYDWNGRVEMRCIDGFKFTVSPTANGGNTVRQVMDEFGHGVRCE